MDLTALEPQPQPTAKPHSTERCKTDRHGSRRTVAALHGNCVLHDVTALDRISEQNSWRSRPAPSCKCTVYGLNGRSANFVIALSLGGYGHAIRKSRSFTALFSRTSRLRFIKPALKSTQKRTDAGRPAAARDRGVKAGRPAKLSAHQQQEIIRTVRDGSKTAADAARLVGVHRSSITRLLVRWQEM
jgi:hypothetical protein